MRTGTALGPAGDAQWPCPGSARGGSASRRCRPAGASQFRCGTRWESSSPAVCRFCVTDTAFPPSWVPFGSLRGCIAIRAAPANISVPWRRRCQKAVFRRLSRAGSPETPRPSERELRAACQHKGLFQDSAEASVGFTGCCRGERSAAVHKEPECGHLLHLHLSQQHRVAEREEFIRQNRILKVFSLGYVKSTNPRAKACKMTVLNLPPSLRGHRVPLVLLHVDISVLTNHGLEAVSFKSVIPTVPLGWFLAVPSSLWFMHPTRDFRQRFSSFQTLANITLLKRYDYVGEHLAL